MMMLMKVSTYLFGSRVQEARQVRHPREMRPAEAPTGLRLQDGDARGSIDKDGEPWRHESV